VKFGGYIALDNAERKPYGWVEEAARRLGFDMLDFWGPGPYNRYFWRTILLRKTRDRYALNELDVKLERYLDFDGGTFVEAGANDGVSQSNTLYFEGRRGWRGMLIEPVPHLAQECRRYRPHAIVEQAALVASERNADAVVLRYANLMSTMKGAMRTVEEEDAHIATACEVQKIETYELSAVGATLSSLLDKHGLRNVDLLCIDVEGYELNALRGLDLTRHRPRFIMVEARYRDEVHAYLSSEYELVEELSFHDLLYRLRSDTGSTLKASQQMNAAPAQARA
jgi:FkbM family methyltransferase